MTLLLLLAALQAPSEEACLEFARGVEKATAARDPKGIDGALDLKALLDRTVEGVEGKQETIDGFRRGLSGGFSLGAATVKAVEASGHYRFLRLRNVAGETRALFRLVTDGSFNYHEYLLVAGQGGRARAVDLYVHLSGEWISGTFRRALVTALAAEPGALARLAGKENLFLKHLPTYTAFFKSVREGRFKEALALYDELPAELQGDKSVLVMRCTASNQVGPEEAAAAFKAFSKAHPKDPSLLLLSLGPSVHAGEHDRALKILDELGDAVGGDPYLLVQRAEVLVAAAKLKEAREAGLKAAEQDPKLPDAYWVLIGISLRAKDWPDTVRWLDAVESRLGIEIRDLRELPDYADFVKSTDYAAWAKKRSE